MSETRERILPTYIWEAPVRIWHWVMVTCLVVLAATGYLIGSPPPSITGEGYDHFMFGYIRFAHFTAGLLFAVMFVLRVVWAFLGNRFSREMFLVPLSMFSPTWWSGFLKMIQHYLFLRGEVQPWLGHNPLAASGTFFMYLLGTVFMICTGLAMYGEDLGMQSWVYAAFSSWVLPLLGYSQNVHTLHHLGMWYLIVFAIIHIYLVLREDICSGETVVSTMVNGWRVPSK